MGRAQDFPFFTLSPSKAETFESCRKRYWFRYLQRLPDPQDYERHPGALVGIAVHRAMHVLGDTGRVDRAEESYAAYLSTPEHASAGPGTERFDDGLAVLRQGRQAHEELLALGGEHFYEHDGWADSGSLRFRAKADRVVRLPDGSLCVVDWKTGDGGFWGPGDDLQAMLLHVVTRAGFGVRADARIRVVLWNLRSGRQDERVETRAHAVAAVRALTAQSRRMMQTKEYRASPGPLCRWCPFFTLCPDAAEQPSPGASPTHLRWLEADD